MPSQVGIEEIFLKATARGVLGSASFPSSLGVPLLRLTNNAVIVFPQCVPNPFPSSCFDADLYWFFASPLPEFIVRDFLKPRDTEYLTQTFVYEDLDLFHKSASLSPSYRAIQQNGFYVGVNFKKE